MAKLQLPSPATATWNSNFQIQQQNFRIESFQIQKTFKYSKRKLSNTATAVFESFILGIIYWPISLLYHTRLAKHYWPISLLTYFIVVSHQVGETPLHIAAMNGNAAMVRFLINKKAGVGKKNKVVS